MSQRYYAARRAARLAEPEASRSELLRSASYFRRTYEFYNDEWNSKKKKKFKLGCKTARKNRKRVLIIPTSIAVLGV